jgi:AcrR family transcriptional regulator
MRAEGVQGKASESSHSRVHLAALRLFAARGFQGTGIRQIANEAGISLASLYHHMGTKEELLDGFMRSGMQLLLEPAAEVRTSGTDIISQVVELVRLHVRTHGQEQLLALVTDTELRSLSPERRTEIIALRDAYEAIWLSAIMDGAETGVFQVRDPKLAVLGILQMCTGVVLWYSPDGRLTLDEVADIFVDMTLSLLGTKPGQTCRSS